MIKIYEEVNKKMNSDQNQQEIENAIRIILKAIGENPNRQGLLLTPARVAKMYFELFSGVNKEPKEAI